MPNDNRGHTRADRWQERSTVLVAERMRHSPTSDIMASPGGRRQNRIPGVDRGKSTEAFEVCWAARRQNS
jgi:hypothetical protein